MELIRKRIEAQVMSLTGLSLNTIDYENPPGDPGLFGQDAVCWRVHSDFPSMLCGGIGALMLQMMHPLALAGVWDHSNFRADMLGRLRRTSQFIAGTTFAATADANALISRVRRMHDQVSGMHPDGRSYSANDPELLTWVHVAEVRSFLTSYLRYRNPDMSLADQDRYFEEVALIAERLGAVDVPKSRKAVDDWIQQRRPQLVFDERTAEVQQLLLNAPAPNVMARPVGYLMTQAGLSLLPDWAQDMARIRFSPRQQWLIDTGMKGLGGTLRWAIRNGASNRARRRMAARPG
ncbi:oxygenase MpaB family protein [Parathalassolituus penaei]|uniref:Oxygenase MpaB family protein n=1 Tax=Parathalassolituus penaei TaxID=2997323 RepID=A0A9X3ECE9_9GAMM|nr:oxygenase MpaB family protein [Parathalassolituus penaei]MCY0964556.1 oxygenase MpaB family protein [Parathalassolituus penaei]